MIGYGIIAGIDNRNLNCVNQERQSNIRISLPPSQLKHVGQPIMPVRSVYLRECLKTPSGINATAHPNGYTNTGCQLAPAFGQQRSLITVNCCG